MGRNNGARFRAMRARRIKVATLCPICGKPIDRDRSYWTTDDDGRRRVDPLAPTLDHRTARARGGDDSDSNADIVHAGCNFAKGDRPAASIIKRSATL